MNGSELFHETSVRDLCAKARQIYSSHGLSPEDGEDAAQQVLLKLHENPQLVERIEKRSFLLRWIDYRAKDQCRANARYVLTELADQVQSLGINRTPDADLQSRDLRRLLGRRIMDALGSLQGKRHRAMVAYLIHLLEDGVEPPYRVIAEEIRTSVATVCRAREELREALGKDLHEIWQASPKGRRRYHRS